MARIAGYAAAALLVCATMLAAPVASAEDEPERAPEPRVSVMDDYDPQTAGHPLRILAYVLHPVGVFFDYVILRPAWWLGSHEPLRTIFGRTD